MYPKLILKVILFFPSLMLFNSMFAQDLEVIGKTSLCPGENVHFWVNGDSIHKWAREDYPSDILSEENPFEDEIGESTNYLLYTSNDTLLISVFLSETDCSCQYYVPNAFTPDGDQFNEYFEPVINCDYSALRTTIYDRTNRVIFDSNELNPSWNGEDYLSGETLSIGQYVYQITMLRANGETVEIVGFVLLMR